MVDPFDLGHAVSDSESSVSQDASRADTFGVLAPVGVATHSGHHSQLLDSDFHSVQHRCVATDL